MRIPTDREPTHPGEMLREEFLIPMGISQQELANAINVPCRLVNELIDKRRGITPGTALRLSKFFGVTVDYWLILQVRRDLYQGRRRHP